MRVCFIEDTDLRGGTQIWVSEAIRDFLAAGVEVTLLTSATGFNAEDGRKTDSRVDPVVDLCRDAVHPSGSPDQDPARAIRFGGNDLDPESLERAWRRSADVVAGEIEGPTVTVAQDLLLGAVAKADRATQMSAGSRKRTEIRVRNLDHENGLRPVLDDLESVLQEPRIIDSSGVDFARRIDLGFGWGDVA